MRIKFVYYFVVILLFAGFISCLIPVPYYKTGYETLSERERQLYNDTLEFEESQNHDITNYGNIRNQMSEVVKLDWFNVVNNMFTKYTLVAKVIDVDSKKSYYVKRVGGYNHADVQPINAANTAIMKEIYGGVWSWARRAVWININGTYVAASINGMPHGFSLIEGNNINGHTCIHFLNSKTHGSKLVDGAHQAAVAKAYNKRQELYNLLS